MRTYAARVAWLDAPLRWDDATRCIAREMPEGKLWLPQATDIARATYCLNRISAHPVSAPAALGDAEAWLTEKRVRLALAKRLLASYPVGDARYDTPLADLLTLLRAEALCSDALEPSPTRLICSRAASDHTFTAKAISSLYDLAEDTAEPFPARMLAALSLGVLEAGNGFGAVAWKDARLSAARQWGRDAGTSSLLVEPGTVVRVMTVAPPDKAADYLTRIACSCDALQSVPLDPLRLLRNLIDAGVPLARTIELVEAAADELPSLFIALLRRREELPPFPYRETPDAATSTRTIRGEVARSFAHLIEHYTRDCAGDPRAVRRIARFARRMLGRTSLTSHLDTALLTPLRAGLSSLSVPVRSTWLRLLAGDAEGDKELIWCGNPPEPQSLRPKRSDWQAAREQAGRAIKAWLENNWAARGKPALKLLERSRGDIALVREALEISYTLWPFETEVFCLDPDRCRWLLYALPLLAEGEPASHDVSLRYNLRRLVEVLPEGTPISKLHRTLSPLVRTLAAVHNFELRVHLFNALRYEMGSEHSDARSFLSAVTPHLPTVIRLLALIPSELWDIGDALFNAAALLSQSSPASEVTRVLEKLFQWQREQEDPCDGNLTRTVALFLTHLAQGDAKSGDALLTAVNPHRTHFVNVETHTVRAGLEKAARCCPLRATLLYLMPRQPLRCLDLLRGLTATERLGTSDAVLAPLDLLDPWNGTEEVPAEERKQIETDDPQWSALLELAPDLAPIVADYWYACWLLGESAPRVPPGVRRDVLELPDRLARELAYLEAIATPPPGMVARMEMLRARLTDTEKLSATRAAEALERLTDLAREAYLAAVEGQIEACYRARLALLVGGGLPPDFVFDGDLRNATLIASQIASNRKLLLRILRAHVEGAKAGRSISAREFVETLPANQEFMERLTQSGADARDWRGEHPERIVLPASGRRVCLYLERDPLAILQMGNLFNTCLSMGNINAFSTVANAADLNKRVLYARDEATGRVVGRKLIGLTAEFKLLGFHTYCSLPHPESEELEQAVRSYCLRFADRCRVALTDQGTIPTLASEDWYDDGSELWNPVKEIEEGVTGTTVWEKVKTPLSAKLYTMSTASPHPRVSSQGVNHSFTDVSLV